LYQCLLGIASGMICTQQAPARELAALDRRVEILLGRLAGAADDLRRLALVQCLWPCRVLKWNLTQKRSPSALISE
jgi:hypothetical protein